MRLALLLVTFVSLAAHVSAPGTVKGRVLDRHGDVLPGVDIVAVPAAGPWVRTVTDSTWHYELADLAAGTYEVQARLNGFVEPASQTVRIGDGSPTGHVNFILCPVIEEIDYFGGRTSPRCGGSPTWCSACESAPRAACTRGAARKTSNTRAR